MAIAPLTSDMLSTGTSDEPVFFPDPDQTYFGIVSAPTTGGWKSTGVVLLSGTSGGTTTVGRNRIWVKLARQLAERGFPVLRLDYAGLGHSIGEMVSYELETPAVPELQAAFDLLASRGVSEFIVVGTCYGSRTALVGSLGEPRVAGVHLLVPPVRSGTKGWGGPDHFAEYYGSKTLATKALHPRMLKKMARDKRTRKAARRVARAKMESIIKRLGGLDAQASGPSKEAARDFHLPLRKLLSEGVPVHLLFGTDDFYWTQFQQASSLRLGQDLERYDDLVEVETVPGIMRGFLSLRAQVVAINSVVQFVEKRTS